MKTLKELSIEFGRPLQVIEHSYNNYDSVLYYYNSFMINKEKALTEDFLSEYYISYADDVEYYKHKLLRSLHLELNEGHLLRKNYEC